MEHFDEPSGRANPSSSAQVLGGWGVKKPTERAPQRAQGAEREGGGSRSAFIREEVNIV